MRSYKDLFLGKVMNIGTRIKILRRKKRLTQRKLAELIGKESSFISHIERNARNVSFHLLLKISEALETSPIQLLSLGGNSEFELAVQKMNDLDEENLHKLNDYIEFLLMTQKKGNIT